MAHNAYEAGYQSCPCFWGTEPASYVRLLADGASMGGREVLDLGAGEGKNAAFLATQGAEVHAIDLSEQAIANGKRAWPEIPIRWEQADVAELALAPSAYDGAVAYGLFHCFEAQTQVETVLARLDDALRPGAFIVVCAFNNREQDLAAAHPGFSPLLLSHDWYVDAMSRWRIEVAADGTIHETHPHNGIAHSHSLTRVLAWKD